MEGRIKKSFCGLLLLLLLVPNIGLVYNVDVVDNCEKRALATFPQFSLTTAWPEDLESYYRDHFTFRNLTAHISSNLKRKIFHCSAKPEVVCQGKEGWIYYNSADDQMLGSYAHTNLWSPKVLIQKVKAWEIRKEKLEKQGIQYHMAIWPNKTTIYPEHLPYRMKKQIRNNDSKTDQISAYLHETNSSIKLLDPRKLLLTKKKQEKIYHQLDSHWNGLGAFYAYQELMIELGMTSLSIKDYELGWTDTSSGDLKDLMGLCNKYSMIESAPQLILKSGTKSPTKQTLHPHRTAYYINPAAATEQILMVFSDSYTDIMIPYLYEHFHKLYFVGTDYNEKLILELKPDIVIVAKVERRL